MSYLYDFLIGVSIVLIICLVFWIMDFLFRVCQEVIETILIIFFIGGLTLVLGHCSREMYHDAQLHWEKVQNENRH